MPRRHRPPLRAALAVVATALLAATALVSPTGPVAGALTPAPAGYWVVGGDGSVYGFGAAREMGSLRGRALARPVTGMAPTPTGAGYWFVASDGGIFSFGDAAFYGSTGNIKLNKPIVGMAATPSGKGYWFVASDGGIFSFGDAAFYGSTGNIKLSQPIVGMAASPTGKGYWFVAADGGIFNFGDAAFLGAAAGKALPAGVVVMAGVRGATPIDPQVEQTTADPAPSTATSGPTTTATTGPARSGEAFDIGLVGDSGYRQPQYAIFDEVVQQMNTFPLAFVVHDGDFKDPTTPCTDDLFGRVRDSFNKSKAPFVYTPGDNEWMDCDKVLSNPMDRVERLNTLRGMFFPQDQSLGLNPMPLATQRQDGYPENARWTREGVVFATINAPGPNDDTDYCVTPDTAPCPPGGTYEAGPRRVANKAWLRQAFDVARSTNAPAVMIIWQVDPWQPGAANTHNRRNWDYLMGCEDKTNPVCQEPGLRQLAKAFGKPVVLVHGDTHIPRIDKGGWPTPRPDGSVDMVGAFSDVPNFTRVETYAGGQPTSTSPLPPEPHKWLRVTVDPKSPQVFTFTTETAS